MAEIELVGYLILNGLSIFWSASALNTRKVIPALLSFVCWVTDAIVHLAFFADSPLQPVGWLFIGFALIFLILSFDAVFKMVEGGRK